MIIKTSTPATQFAEIPPDLASTDATFGGITNDRVRRVASSAADATAAASATAAAASAACLQISANLSDLASAATARLNLLAVTRTALTNPLGAANTTYSVTQMQQVITLLGQIVTALNH